MTRISFSIIGILFIALGLNILLSCDFGISSFDTVTNFIAVSNEIAFSSAALVVHGFFVAILLIYCLFKKVRFGAIIISCLSIFILTRVIEILSMFADMQYDDFYVRVIMFIIGYSLFCFGAVFCMKANLFIAPVDKFVIETSTLLKKNPGYIRMIVDFSLLIIAIIWSSYTDKVSVTIFTIVITFGTGFVIKFLYPLFKGVR